jgi:O-antigen/teichoic acid export membrane protein
MKAFLSNLLFLMAGNFYTLVINFVFSLVLVQKLSDANFGMQSAIIAFTTIIMSLAYMGLPNVSSRELTGRSPEEQHVIYSSIFSLQILLSTIVCSLAVVVAALLNSFPGPQFIIFFFGVFTLVLSYAPIAPTESLLVVRGQMWRMAILQSTYATWTCLVGVFLLLSGGTIGSIYAVFSFLSVVTILQYIREARRLVPGGPRFIVRKKQWLYFLRQGIPGGLGGFFFMATRLIGTYLVYTFISNVAAGYLGLSYLLVQATMLVIWVTYAVSIMPVMTRLFGENQSQFKWFVRRSLVLLLAMSLPIGLGGSLLASDILRILGEGKVAAAPTLQIFIWMIPLSIFAEFFYRTMLVVDSQRSYLAATVLGAMLTIICCVVLIPLYGVQAAALASIVGTTWIVGMCGWALRRWLSIRAADVVRLGMALAALVLVLTVTAQMSIYPRIGLGAVLYGIMVVSLGLFVADDWRTAKQLLSTVTHEPSTASAAREHPSQPD